MSNPTGTSSLSLNLLQPQNPILSAPGVAETVVGSGSGCYSGPIPWYAIGGTNFRLGITGKFIVTGSAVTLRVRCGGVSVGTQDTSALGTIVYTTTIPVGTTFLDNLTSSIARPAANISNLQLTWQQASGTATVEGINAFIVPDYDFQGQLIADTTPLLNSGTTEIVREQFLVDFAQYNTSYILLVWAGICTIGFGETYIFNVRQGGTSGTADGTIIASLVDKVSGGFKSYVYTSALIANPGSAQLLKLSVQSMAGAGSGMDRMSFFIKGVS